MSEISHALIRPILEKLVETIAQEFLLSFRRVDCFSTGGMLQATLEIEFLHTTLNCYQSEKSKGIFAQIYDSIEKTTISLETVDDGKMNDMLLQVKAYLAQAKQTTGVQFMCFREISSSNEAPVIK